MAYQNLTNVTGFTSVVVHANTITDGYFGFIIILLIFMISFISLKNYTTERALAASGFITGFFAIIMSTLGILSNTVMIPIVILGALSVFWLIGMESK